MKKLFFLVVASMLLLIACNDREEEQDQYDEIAVGYIYESFEDEETSSLVNSITEVTEGPEGEQTTTTTTTLVKQTDSGINGLPSEEVVEIEVPPATTTTTTIAVSYNQQAETSYYNPVEETVGATTTTSVMQVAANGATYHITVEEVVVNQIKDMSSTGGEAGGYFEVGTGYSGQTVSPRDYIKATAVVMSDNSTADYVDFQLYAFPKDGGIKRYGYNMLGYAYYVEMINGQAQFTRYWNGKNVYGNFLEEGNYNLYIYYKIKAEDGTLIDSGGKYWGDSTSYYISLK